MIRYNPKQLSTDDSFLLSNLLTAMEGQPESAIYASLSAFPQFKAIMTYRSEELFELVDKAVEPHQPELLEAYNAYFEALTVLEAESMLQIDLMTDEVKYERDTNKRLVGWVRIDLWKNKRYMSARRSAQTKQIQVSLVWNKSIPESVVPFEEVDRTAQGGTRGMERIRLPKWEFREGKIVSQREEVLVSQNKQATP